jgi:hypothetical protein
VEEDTAKAIREQDRVPNRLPMNRAAFEIEKQSMLSHGDIKNDFDVHKWAATEFLEMAASVPTPFAAAV